MNSLIRYACLAVFVGAPAIGDAALAQDLGWVGTFVNEQQTTEGIESAIETAVAKMNFIKRPIARSRLKKTNTAYERIAITRTDDVISVTFDDHKPIEMPADGRPVKWAREDGEEFEVTARASAEKLVQTFKAEDGQRVNTFSANDAGQMTMESQLTSDQLSTPVIYTLLYHRNPE